MSEELKKWALEAVRVEGGLFGVTCGCADMEEAVRTWVEVEEGELGGVEVSDR